MRLTILLIGVLFLTFEVKGQVRFGKMLSPQKTQEDEFQLNYTNPKVYEIADIKVEGSEFLDHTALISIAGLKVGDNVKIPGDDISNAIKKLWQQGIIGNVEVHIDKIVDNKVYLLVIMTERPRLSRINFSGINKTQQSDVKDKVKLIRGRVVTDALLQSTQRAVREHFVEKGFLNCEVKMIQEKDTVVSNSVKLTIEVDTKKKVKVNNIYFEGNENLAATKLKSKMKNTGERPRFNLVKGLTAEALHLVTTPRRLWAKITRSEPKTLNDAKEYFGDFVKVNIFKSNKYIRKDYQEDKESLIAFYNSRGYRDAEILQDTVYAINSRQLNIRMKIDEGQKYYFRDIDWVGNFVHEDETLDKLLGIRKGDVYDMEFLNKKLHMDMQTGQDISSLYMDDGYLFFNVTPVEVGVAGDSIDIELRMREGPQATVNKIIVKGNDRTNDHVIYREIRTLPGQKFNRSLLMRTQRELSQLGYFDPEQIGIQPIPNPVDETVDIEYVLVERPSDQIELSGGWGGLFGFVGSVGLVFNNFSAKNITKLENWRPLPAGDGQRLSLNVRASGAMFQNYNFSFNEPWLGGRKPNNFGISLNYSVQRNFDIFTNRNFGGLNVAGATISLGRRVSWPDDYFTVSNSLSFQQYALDNFSGFGFGVGGGNAFGFTTGSSNNFSFNTTIARNSVDQPMYPRTGSEISLQVQLTPPYSLMRDQSIDYREMSNEERFRWTEYHRWMFDSKYYLNIIDKLVLATRAHMGYMGAYNPALGVGPFERYQLGGDGITGMNFIIGAELIGLRGYENNSIVPRDELTGVSGGTIYNKFVMELRYPVSLNPSATIYIQSFLEAGNNWNSFNDFNPFDLYRSAGVGARIFMPAFGLLGVDWGYGFDTLPGRSEPSGAQFHFTIGQQIR